MIRLIKKKAKSIVCSVLAAVTLFTMNPAVFATETATQTDTVSGVDVSGSDSSDAADKSNTDSNADSTTTAGSNDEEHKYLYSYISKSEIGTRSLSSVLITEDKKGAGLSVSTHNINYCTVGMYKNALATAGIADAKIIVAGPFPISGTAALVGTLKAYEEMTGKKLDDKVTDAAMDELVTTGELNKSIDGDSQDIEAMIADLKKQLADGRLKDESQIKDAIKEAAKDYDLKLSDDDIAKLTSLLMKLKDANIDWDSVINQAQDWASKLGDKINDPGFWEKLGNFFMDLWDKIKSLFS